MVPQLVLDPNMFFSTRKSCSTWFPLIKLVKQLEFNSWKASFWIESKRKQRNPHSLSPVLCWGARRISSWHQLSQLGTLVCSPQALTHAPGLVKALGSPVLVSMHLRGPWPGEFPGSTCDDGVSGGSCIAEVCGQSTRILSTSFSQDS